MCGHWGHGRKILFNAFHKLVNVFLLLLSSSKHGVLVRLHLLEVGRQVGRPKIFTMNLDIF